MDRDSEDLSSREAVARSLVEDLERVSVNAGNLAQAEGLRVAEEVITRFGGDPWISTQLLVARARLRQAMFLSRLDEDDRALQVLDEVSARYVASQSDDEREVGADALLAKGDLLAALRRHREAREVNERITSEFAASTHLGIRHTHALAQLRLLRTEDSDDERQALFEAIRRDHGGPIGGPEAWVVLASARQHAKASEAGEVADAAAVVAQELWQRYRDTDDVPCRRELGLLRLEGLRRLDLDQETIDGAGEVIAWLEPYEQDPQLIDVATLARVDKAAALNGEGRPAEALAVVEELLHRFSTSADPDVIGHEAWAEVERGLLLQQLERPAEAVECWRSTLRFLDASGDPGWVHALRLRVAHAHRLVFDQLSSLAPEPPSDLQAGADGVSVAREASAVEQPPMVPSEVAMADAARDLVTLFEGDEHPDIAGLVANALHDLADHQRRRLHLDDALATYARLSRRYLTSTVPDVEVIVARGMMNAGFIQMVLLRRFAEALETYNAALDRYGNHTSPRMRDLLAKVHSSRIACIAHLTREGQVIDLGEGYELLTPEELRTAEALQAEAIATEERGDHRAAIAVLDQILSAHEASTHPEWRRRCLDAVVRKVWSLKQLGQSEAAILACDVAVGRYSADLSMDLEKDVARLLAYKASELDKLGRHDEELVTYEEIIGRWSDNNVAFLAKKVSNARLCKAITLADLGRQDEAIAAYQQTLPHASDSRVDVARDGVVAFNNLGILLRKLGRPQEALQMHELALRHSQRDDATIRKQAAVAHAGLGRAYVALGDKRQAMTWMDAALASPPGDLRDSVRSALVRERGELAVPDVIRRGLGRWFGR